MQKSIFNIITVWLITLLLAGAAIGQATGPGAPSLVPEVPTERLRVVPNLPPVAIPVSNAQAQVSGGNPGRTVYYYWIVANFAIGSSGPSGPFSVTGPDSLGGGNSILVSWTPPGGATSFDLLRTTTPTAPTGACNCAVTTGTTANNVTDSSNSLNAYTVTGPYSPGSLDFTLTNEPVGSTTHLMLRQNGTLIQDLNLGGGFSLTPSTPQANIVQPSADVPATIIKTFNGGSSDVFAVAPQAQVAINAHINHTTGGTSVTVNVANSFVVGQKIVQIVPTTGAGACNANYNGIFTVTAQTAGSYTFTLAGSSGIATDTNCGPAGSIVALDCLGVDASGNVQLCGTQITLGSANTTSLGQFQVFNNAIGTTASDSLVMTNGTAATVGAQVQYAPSINLGGAAWNTGSVASNTVNVRLLAVPAAGNPPTVNLNFLASINGGAYAAAPITVASCSGCTANWNGITNPTGNQALTMGTNTTSWTWGNINGGVGFLNTFGALTGSPSVSQMSIIDTTGNTNTGALLNLNTVGTSTALPLQVTAQGTANGVQMTAAGVLQAIGTGGIKATTATNGGITLDLIGSMAASKTLANAANIWTLGFTTGQFNRTYGNTASPAEAITCGAANNGVNCLSIIDTAGNGTGSLLNISTVAPSNATVATFAFAGGNSVGGNNFFSAQATGSPLSGAGVGVQGNGIILGTQNGGASTAAAGGLGGQFTFNTGAGGATTGTNQTGGNGGAFVFSAGQGGTSSGTAANSNGGGFTFNNGAAGTGGSGAAGTAGVFAVVGGSVSWPAAQTWAATTAISPASGVTVNMSGSNTFKVTQGAASSVPFATKLASSPTGDGFQVLPNSGTVPLMGVTALGGIAEGGNFTNNSGSTINANVLVKPDSGNDSSVVLTATTDTNLFIGVTAASCTNTSKCEVTTHGVAQVTNDGGCTRAQFAIVSATTAGRIQCTGTFTAGAIVGQVLASATTGNLTTILVQPK